VQELGRARPADHIVEVEMRHPLTVAQRLLLGFGLVLVLLLAIALLAWRSLSESDEALKSVYEDRTLPMQQLSTIRYLATRDRVILTDAADSPNAGKTQKRLAEFDKNRALARSQWTAYMATGFTPEETSLARRQQAAMQAYVDEGLVPAAEALRREDPEATRQALLKVSTLSPPAQETLDELLKLQVDVARQVYEKAAADNAAACSSSSCWAWPVASPPPSRRC
jgi:hypothetical protein